MSNQYDEGGPAFPTTPLETIVSKDRDGDTVLKNFGCGSGMTLRQYAAIKLAVPDSGLPWLDEIIVKSRRERLAAAALQPLVTSAIELDHVKWDATAKHAYLCADAMLKAREDKP